MPAATGLSGFLCLRVVLVKGFVESGLRRGARPRRARWPGPMPLATTLQHNRQPRDGSPRRRVFRRLRDGQPAATDGGPRSIGRRIRRATTNDCACGGDQRTERTFAPALVRSRATRADCLLRLFLEMDVGRIGAGGRVLRSGRARRSCSGAAADMFASSWK